MKTEKKFTIRLANSRERAFDEASAMAEWMNSQRGLEYRGGRRRSQTRLQSQPRRRKKQKQNTYSETPLARYANRHSGEA